MFTNENSDHVDDDISDRILYFKNHAVDDNLFIHHAEGDPDNNAKHDAL